MTETTASTRVPLSTQLIGGPAVPLEIGGLPGRRCPRCSDVRRRGRRGGRTGAVVPLPAPPRTRTQPGTDRPIARETTMEFLVDMVTTVPEGTTDAQVDAMRIREAARSRELGAQGHLLRLWRPPLKA